MGTTRPREGCGNHQSYCQYIIPSIISSRSLQINCASEPGKISLVIPEAGSEFPHPEKLFLKRTICLAAHSARKKGLATCTYGQSCETHTDFLILLQVFFVDSPVTGWAIFAFFETLSVLSFRNISKLFII